MSLICGDVLFDSRGVAEADVLVSCQFVHEVHDLQSEAAADVNDPLNHLYRHFEQSTDCVKSHSDTEMLLNRQ